MKKFLVLLVLTLLVGSLFADLMTPTGKQAILRDNVIETRKVSSQTQYRDVPDYEFVIQPISLVENYYDYMPGSYNSTPIRLQEDQFGGVYMAFHGSETDTGTRRTYYAYIDETGNPANVATIASWDIHEGYPGLDIDPVTGDPFVSWHVDVQAPAGAWEDVCTYDLYHMIPGLWVDEFIWPYAHIGPSPDPDKRRIYIQANNNYSSGDPTENPMIAYADFNGDDLNIQSTLDWTYFTISIFDDWNQSNPEWIRPFHSFAVSEVDGTIAFFGYNTNDEVYVCYNDNYGEGDWTYTSMQIDIDTWNPQNLDGTYVFLNDDNDPYDLYWAPIYSHHMTSVFFDGSNQMTMEIAMGLQTRPDVPGGDSFYFPFYIFPYIVKAISTTIRCRNYSKVTASSYCWL